ncbi:hypothetical protein CALCODRAFT_131611 [Calocera cornea HHB12733]|uniref:Uncharacterized protein n=1 Tax=Calocera cornea HHB12733 TaxID=1353952 RepID=A0A165CWB5_9BASI|nr:hypothetical protein CALCODRAFT_131611 [Calocera cornea HHB12733]
MPSRACKMVPDVKRRGRESGVVDVCKHRIRPILSQASYYPQHRLAKRALCSPNVPTQPSRMRAPFVHRRSIPPIISRNVPPAERPVRAIATGVAEDREADRPGSITSCPTCCARDAGAPSGGAWHDAGYVAVVTKPVTEGSASAMLGRRLARERPAGWGCAGRNRKSFAGTARSQGNAGPAAGEEAVRSRSN